MASYSDYQKIYEQAGGKFISTANDIAEKLKNTRALLFDWDGVFNSGCKGSNVTAPFSEIDSSGINILRFALWLNNKKKHPFCGIITGQENPSALQFAEREHFHFLFFKVKNKVEALQLFQEKHHLSSDEILFFYDDIIDISIAQKVKLRACIPNNASPLFLKEIENNKLADYITANCGGKHAVREASEMFTALTGKFKDTFDKRVAFDNDYESYFSTRNTIKLSLLVAQGNHISLK